MDSPFSSTENKKLETKKSVEFFISEWLRKVPEDKWQEEGWLMVEKYNKEFPEPLTSIELQEIYNLLKDVIATENETENELEEKEIEKSLQLQFIKDKKKGTFALAEYLTKKFNIITVGEHEREIYAYQSGYYRRAENEMIYPEIQRILGNSIDKNAKSETMHKIADMTSYARSVFKSASINLIPLKNGVYVLLKKVLLPHSPEYHFTYQFPLSYNAAALCLNVQAFFSQVLPSYQIPLLEEWIGYYFYRQYLFKKAIIFVGAGNTGKTTLLETIINLVGKDNIASIPLQKMAGDKFAAANLYEKHGNIVDELSAKDIADTGNFKIATGGGSIAGEYKYGNQFSFQNFAKFTFACNKIPDVKDFDDEAYFDRWMVVKFENIIEKKIPDFVKTLTTDEEQSGLFNLAMIGLERLLDKKEFSNAKTAMETKIEMMQSGSSIGIFTAKCLTQENGVEMTKEDMYRAYATYCTENKLGAATMKMFGQRLPFYASYVMDGKITSISGKRERGWLNAKLIEEPQEAILDDSFDAI